MSIAQSFLRDTANDGSYHLFCTGCPRAGEDCGCDRDKVSQEARKQGYKLVPGLGWLCNACYWAVEFETQISGTVETVGG